jgi:hypothetical protein
MWKNKYTIRTNKQRMMIFIPLVGLRLRTVSAEKLWHELQLEMLTKWLMAVLEGKANMGPK